MGFELKPITLYKYCDDSPRTEDIIKNKKVWLSFPKQLNDLFECRIGEIPPEWEENTIRELEIGQLMGNTSLYGSPSRLFSL